MGKDTPRYFIEPRTGKFYWQPSSELRALGWPAERLSQDRSVAVARAVAINTEVDAWVAAGKPARTDNTSSPESSPGSAASGARRTSSSGSVNALLDLYQFTDDEYPTNENTKRQYDGAVKYLRKWIGPFPVKTITPRMAMKRYQKLAKRAPAQAASIMRVARRAFGRARFLSDPHQAVYIAAKDNPFLELNLKGSQSEGRLWTRDERDKMVAMSIEKGFPSIACAIEVNWWLAQREGDILGLPPNALQQSSLVIRQNKTLRRVDLPIQIVPAIAAAVARYLETRKGKISSSTHLLVDERTGQPWDEHAFRHVFADVRDAAECDPELKFMYLRHTGIVEMQDSECTISEIGSVSGHSLSSITSILERYGRRTKKQAANAFNKRILKEREDGG